MVCSTSYISSWMTQEQTFEHVFFTFYHGKSPLIYHLGNIFGNVCQPPNSRHSTKGPCIGLTGSYCWSLKSCTSWYEKYPMIYILLYASQVVSRISSIKGMFIGLHQSVRWNRPPRFLNEDEQRSRRRERKTAVGVGMARHCLYQ